MPRRRAHRGWTEAHVRRVFWRAGFGATPREARHWARRGKGATIRWLLNGGPSPAPRIKRARASTGTALDPENEWGHDVLWWLDRMVRSRHPLQEKLTLFWHDHFATTDQDTPLMLRPEPDAAPPRAGPLPGPARRPSRATRRCCCSSRSRTPTRRRPNENYARELMELFTLGRGYSERDIRQAARALTGFQADWHDDGSVQHLLRPRVRTTPAPSACSASVGRFDWKDVLDLCVAPSRATRRSWSASCGTSSSAPPLPRRDPRAPGARLPPLRPAASGRWSARSSPTRRCTGTSTRPTWSSRRWSSWPGRCAAPARASSATPGPGCSTAMGQYPFRPPSVAGWDWGTRWLSSNSMRVRFDFANYMIDTPRVGVEDGSTPNKLSPKQAVARARRAVGDPWTSPRDRPRADAHRPPRARPTRTATRARATCASACCATC